MNVLRTLKRMVRVFTRPVEPEQGIAIVPCRGYGSRDEIFLIGRVSHQRTPASKSGVRPVYWLRSPAASCAGA